MLIQQPDGGIALGVCAERTVPLPIVGASLQGRKEPLPSSEELQTDEEGPQVSSDALLDALREEYNAW